MKINRDRIRKRFEEYVSNYDTTDPKIKLKLEHTYRVGDLSERIGKSLNLCQEDLDLAWAIGMLHDIARFEQCRIFDSFMDGETVDHAKLACHLLFGDSMENAATCPVCISEYGKTNIRQFIEDDDCDQIVHDAIFYHNLYRFPDSLDNRSKMFLEILRDADKIDILRVNCETPLEQVYNVSTDVLKRDEVTPAIMDNFFQKKATDRRLKRTSVDNVVGHISLVFELVYSESLKIVKEQKYIYKLMNFESENEVTNLQFAKIADFMNEYLNNN